jgi:RNA polymerase sigma-70 factor (ECF subfamily)
MFHVATAQFENADTRETLHSLEALSTRCRPRGDIEDLALRLTAERPRQLRFLRSRLPSLQDAEDAWQDAAVKFLRHADALGAAERPEAWMGVSLRRLVVDRYRRADVQRRTLEALAVQPPYETTDTREDLVAPADCLNAALGELKPAYREILAETYLDERPLKAVALHHDLTANNAAVRLHRARNALRQAMAEKCQSCPLADCWAKARTEGLRTPGGASRSDARAA